MNAKDLITGARNVNEAGEPGAPEARPPGGPPRRPSHGSGPGQRRGPSGPGPGGQGGPPGQEDGLSPQEQAALKDLVIIDMLNAFANGDTFYEDLASAALEGRMPDRAQIQHFMQEAGRWAKRFGPAHNELMNKLAAAAQ